MTLTGAELADSTPSSHLCATQKRAGAWSESALCEGRPTAWQQQATLPMDTRSFHTIIPGAKPRQLTAAAASPAARRRSCPPQPARDTAHPAAPACTSIGVNAGRTSVGLIVRCRPGLGRRLRAHAANGGMRHSCIYSPASSTLQARKLYAHLPSGCMASAWLPNLREAGSQATSRKGSLRLAACRGRGRPGWALFTRHCQGCAGH